jgi:hypothetical protein
MQARPSQGDGRDADIVCLHREVDQPWLSEIAELILRVLYRLRQIWRNDFQIMSSAERK